MTNETKNQHPHAALIKAWADGAIIQVYNKVVEKWLDCTDNQPEWRNVAQYRIKPEEPERRIEPKQGDRYLYVDTDGIVVATIWKNISIDYGRYSFGNCFTSELEAKIAAERVKAALRGEESEKMKKLRKENEKLKADAVPQESVDRVPMSPGEIALIRAIRNASNIGDLYWHEQGRVIGIDYMLKSVADLTFGIEIESGGLEVFEALDQIKQENS